MSQPVRVSGAECQPGPSPTAQALRLEGIRARDGASLDALLEALGDPPWDVELAPDDPVVSLLRARGFEEYARAVVMARPVEGLAPVPAAAGVWIGPYSNDWAESYSQGEAVAMAEHPSYQNMGSQTGYEGSEGFDAAIAATAEEQVVGFAQAQLPEGWINWLWVHPDHRRHGVASALVWELANAVRDSRGTHLAALVPVQSEGAALLGKLGFRSRSERVLMLRAADSAA